MVPTHPYLLKLCIKKSVCTHLCWIIGKNIIEVVNFWWLSRISVWLVHCYASIHLVHFDDIFAAYVQLDFVHWPHPHHNSNIFDLNLSGDYFGAVLFLLANNTEFSYICIISRFTKLTGIFRWNYLFLERIKYCFGSKYDAMQRTELCVCLWWIKSIVVWCLYDNRKTSGAIKSDFCCRRWNRLKLYVSRWQTAVALWVRC